MHDVTPEAGHVMALVGFLGAVCNTTPGTPLVPTADCPLVGLQALARLEKHATRGAKGGLFVGVQEPVCTPGLPA